MSENTCKFCKKSFRTEKTLAAHMCVKKKRWSDRDTIGARLGLFVFQRFHELTTSSKKQKTVEDFIESNFYKDFVKFGRHLVALDPISTDKFVDFVIKNGVKLSDWCQDYVYESYLDEILKKESPEMAIERTIIEMQAWAKENDTVFQDYFKDVSPVEATFKIKSGKISPWVLYLSETGGELMERMTSEQASIVNTVIDPNKWQVRFMMKPADVEYVVEFLKEANI